MPFLNSDFLSWNFVGFTIIFLLFFVSKFYLMFPIATVLDFTLWTYYLICSTTFNYEVDLALSKRCTFLLF